MSILGSILKPLTSLQCKVPLKTIPIIFIRNKPKEKRKFIEVPKPGAGKQYRRIVHFPEEYTVKPLNVTHLGGRDPVTGRVVVGTLGGGVKHKYHWVDWERDGPSEGPPLEEKVLKIMECGCRSANVALVAVKDKLKYILATENMKSGDVLKTSKCIPKNPVKPNEGDAYPLGALAIGTIVHNVKLHPTSNYTFIHAAGCYGTVKKHLDGKVVVQLPSKREMAFEPECMATVGRLSNVDHSSIPIGSAVNLRYLGYRPRSGLKKKKTGRFGRKIKPLPPVAFFTPKEPEPEFIRCTLPNINI